MQIQLNEQQVLLVEKMLVEHGLDYKPLKGELLDHVCCMIEAQLAEGKQFKEAQQTVFKFFGKDELRNLQQLTISLTNKKSSRMKNLVLAFLAFLIIPSSLFFYSNMSSNHFETAIQPPSPEEMLSLQNHLGSDTGLHDHSHGLQDDPPSIKPVKENLKVTSDFGDLMHPVTRKIVFHKGIDFKAPLGTPVLATSDGQVTFAKDYKKHGLHIVLQHDESFQTKYSHLSELKVKEGDMVKKGDVIGLVGNTGESSGPHLHYEVIKNGQAVNPVDYFNP